MIPSCSSLDSSSESTSNRKRRQQKRPPYVAAASSSSSSSSAAAAATAAFALFFSSAANADPLTCCGSGGGGFGGGSGKWYGGGGGGGGGGDGSGSGLRGGGSASPSKNDAAAADDDDEDKSKKTKVKHITLTLVSFAVTRKAYSRITQMFSEDYERRTGVAVRWRLSFGGSGTQARAICDGLPGDVVALALPLDVQKIADAGLIDADWRARAPNGAVVAESVVGIVVRDGNPLRIRGWDDLARGQTDASPKSSPGSSSAPPPERALNVITANPKTGGGARWNFLALWGHFAKPRSDANDAAAARFCERVFRNVSIQPRDAREASDAFYNQGKGDALLNYENEIIATNEAGEVDPLPYVVPPTNIRVAMPVATVDGNLRRWPSYSRDIAIDAAKAFVEYLFTPEAQQELNDAGFRPVVKIKKPRNFPKVRKLLSVEDDFGGWDAVQAKFFSAGGILDKINDAVAGR